MILGLVMLRHAPLWQQIAAGAGVGSVVGLVTVAVEQWLRRRKDAT